MLRRLTTTPSRVELVYQAIRENICRCILKPGAHLVQEELAEQLGVSRQPVQQALLVLKSEGLVVELPGRGLCVAPLAPELVRHRYQIRLVLDQLAARLVAEKAAASPAFARLLKQQGEDILSQRDLARGDGAHVAIDIAFHTMIYRMSGNPLIAATAEPHWIFLQRMMILVLSAAQRGDTVWRQHWMIFEALVAGDADTAERLATQHVVTAEAALIAVMESTPDVIFAASEAAGHRGPD